MVIVKMIGIGALLFGAIGVGLSANEERRKHIKYLKEWNMALDTMENEIAFQKSTIPEICARIGWKKEEREQENPLWFFDKLEKEIKLNQGLSFKTLWKNCMEETLKTQKLQQEERDILLTIGERLDYEDHDMQQKMLAEGRKALQVLIQRQEAQTHEKAKITLCLSGMCGIVIAVILL